MDGKHRRVILELSIYSTPSGLIVHHMSNNQSGLYYTDRFGQEVYYIDLNSTQSRSFIANELIHPVGLTIQDNNLYISDAGSGIAWDGGVYNTLLGGTGNVSKVIDLLNTPWEIDSYDLDNIYTPGRYFFKKAITSGSSSFRGEVSQYLLLFVKAKTCLCINRIPKIMVQLCVLRLYLDIETVFCRLLQRMVRRDMD